MATTHIRSNGSMMHDVSTDLLAKIRLDRHLCEQGRKLVHLVFRQIRDLARLVDREGSKDPERSLLTNAIEERKCVLLQPVGEDRDGMPLD